MLARWPARCVQNSFDLAFNAHAQQILFRQLFPHCPPLLACLPLAPFATAFISNMRMPGVEPGSQAWEACMMPLHYMRPGYPLLLPAYKL